ncbi:MAG TPA: AMIN domain-containing protein, partial [Gammaproteobacteria bacterium]|nr:AMIN domain-containing protein [Gammaproteobacteria bacterium]
MDCNERMWSSSLLYNSARYRGLLVLLLALILPCLATVAKGADEASKNTLRSIHVSPLGGNRAQIELVLDKPPAKPSTFTIDNPARIALDFPNTRSSVKKKTRAISIGAARRITAVQADGRTRVVLDLTQTVPFNVRVKGNSVFLILNSQAAADAPFTLTPSAKANAEAKAQDGPRNDVEGVDFRRGPAGEGRIVVKLSNPQTPIDMRQEDGKIVVDFLETQVPKKFVKRYDVVDFATPVHTIDLFQSDSSARMVIDAKAPFDKLAYQTKNAFTLEVKHVTKKEQEAEKKKEFGYTGKRLSLNFQNIEVRAALQIIADFTHLNLVTSDSVTGNLTLRLQNVPWDQALDIILKSKGLAMRKTDNVILVAPATEIAAHEKQELESKKQVQALAPLHSELIQINYAKASDITKILQAKGNSFMSKRGSVTIDQRTNTLLVQDTDAK